MSKLHKVERLKEIARSDQARTVANERRIADEIANALEGVSHLVEEYRGDDAAIETVAGLRRQRRFFNELYKTYMAQGQRLADQEQILTHEVSELGQRHKQLTLLRSVLKKREEAHKYLAQKKAARAQIHRGMSKL